MRNIPKQLLLAAGIGFLAGVLWLVAVRFARYKSDAVHYHANFALYVNGKQDTFADPTFYEEVQACGGDLKNDPKTRVHMHNRENDIVHVHDEAVTWGDFLANLGYTLGNEVLATDEGAFIDGEGGRELTFTLNGEQVTAIANRLIESKDILLINYGTEDAETLHERYDAIPATAGEYNGRYDPGGCSGGEELTLWERLRASFVE